MVVLALRILSSEDNHEFEVCPGYVAKPVLLKKNEKHNGT